MVYGQHQALRISIPTGAFETIRLFDEYVRCLPRSLKKGFSNVKRMFVDLEGPQPFDLVHPARQHRNHMSEI